LFDHLKYAVLSIISHNKVQALTTVLLCTRPVWHLLALTVVRNAEEYLVADY